VRGSDFKTEDYVDDAEFFLLRRAGYAEHQIRPSNYPAPTEPYIILCKLVEVEAHYDPFDWPRNRTMTTAHRHIINHWDELTSGDVIDVEFILGETKEPKQSERITHPL